MEPMNDDQRLLRWQKGQLVLALAVTGLLAALWVSLAWLNHTRSLTTATEIHVPTLWIDDIHGTNAMNLGEIDVQNTEETTSDGKPCRRYVFSVKSNDSNSFRLQLAYTTNIPFTYKLYPATESDSGVKVEADGTDYYFTCGTAMEEEKFVQAHNQTYLTITEDASGTQTSSVYDSKYVHDKAEPWYWVSKAQTLNSKDPAEGNYVTIDGSYYTRYYVLEISWDSTLRNNKETDLVYLMAESVSS